LGVSKRAAAEFSFFLSLPTMLGAVSFDLIQSRHELDFSTLTGIGIGLIVATVSGAIVVKWMLSYVSTQGYAVFGWWRIILGLGVLAALFAGF
jgi:undecaprenyl-diphosphatase